MPFDNNLTLINGVALTTTLDAVATSTSYPTSAPLTRAKVVDLGASILTGSPEGTGLNGISIALICTAAVSGSHTLVAYIQASDVAGTWTDGVTIGTLEYSTGATPIASSLAPFHYVIRVQTELRYIRANLEVSGGIWNATWVVVGTHHLERL